jgi:hypothetical protein
MCRVYDGAEEGADQKAKSNELETQINLSLGNGVILNRCAELAEVLFRDLPLPNYLHVESPSL